MIEVGLSEPVAGKVDVVAVEDLSAGMMIRKAREAAGLHIAALAVSMKIPVKKLEALEADRMDLLHDAVFARALASSVCRALKLDPVPVLSRLPSNSAPRLSTDERGINAPFHSAGETISISMPGFLLKPSVLIVLFLLVGVVAVVLYPEIKISEPIADLSLSATKPEVISPAMQPDKFPAELAKEASSNVITLLPTVSAPVNPVPVPQVLPPSAAVATGEAALATPIDLNRASTKAAAVLSALVVFRARGTTWVKVIDANGVIQLSKTLSEGEVVGASGNAPLSVVVGRADATDVEVRGKPFSLAGISKENVARFEVK